MSGVVIPTPKENNVVGVQVRRSKIWVHVMRKKIIFSTYVTNWYQFLVTPHLLHISRLHLTKCITCIISNNRVQTYKIKCTKQTSGDT